MASAARRKYADRSRWVRVARCCFAVYRLEEAEFRGYLTRLELLEVQEPLVVTELGEQRVIADAGFVWLQHFPDGGRYAVTTVFDAAGEAVHWYVDVAGEVGVTDEGVPYWTDLYLDVIALPDGRADVVDEDDVRDGLAAGDISEAEAALARAVATHVYQEVQAGTFLYLRLSREHFARYGSTSA